MKLKNSFLHVGLDDDDLSSTEDTATTVGGDVTMKVEEKDGGKGVLETVDCKSIVGQSKPPIRSDGNDWETMEMSGAKASDGDAGLGGGDGCEGHELLSWNKVGLKEAPLGNDVMEGDQKEIPKKTAKGPAWKHPVQMEIDSPTPAKVLVENGHLCQTVLAMDVDQVGVSTVNVPKTGFIQEKEEVLVVDSGYRKELDGEDWAHGDPNHIETVEGSVVLMPKETFCSEQDGLQPAPQVWNHDNDDGTPGELGTNPMTLEEPWSNEKSKKEALMNKTVGGTCLAGAENAGKHQEKSMTEAHSLGMPDSTNIDQVPPPATADAIEHEARGGAMAHKDHLACLTKATERVSNDGTSTEKQSEETEKAVSSTRSEIVLEGLQEIEATDGTGTEIQGLRIGHEQSCNVDVGGHGKIQAVKSSPNSSVVLPAVEAAAEPESLSWAWVTQEKPVVFDPQKVQHKGAEDQHALTSKRDIVYHNGDDGHLEPGNLNVALAEAGEVSTPNGLVNMDAVFPKSSGVAGDPVQEAPVTGVHTEVIPLTSTPTSQPGNEVSIIEEIEVTVHGEHEGSLEDGWSDSESESSNCGIPHGWDLGTYTISMPFDMGLLRECIENGLPALEQVSNRDVVLVVGKTGSGKSTFINGISLRQLTRKTITNVGQTVGKDVFEAEDEMTGFEIGHSKESVTKCLRAYLTSTTTKNTQIAFVDSPGFEDTSGQEVDVATSVMKNHVVKRCKSLRFVILINYTSLLEDRGGSMRAVLRLTRSFVQDFSSHKASFAFFFTHTNQIKKFPEEIQDARDFLLEELVQILNGTSRNDRDVATIVDHMVKCLRKRKTDPNKRRYHIVDILHPTETDFAQLRLTIENMKPFEDKFTSRTCVLPQHLSMKFESELNSMVRKLQVLLNDPVHFKVNDMRAISEILRFFSNNIEIESVHHAVAESERLFTQYARRLCKIVETETSRVTSTNMKFATSNIDCLKKALWQIRSVSGYTG